MKINLPINTSNLQANSDFVRYVSQVLGEITNILDGQVEFLDNCRLDLASVSFSKIGVQQAIPHSLQKIPSGYIIVRSQGSGVVYDGTTPSTSQYLYVQCTAIETKTILIF